MANLVFFISFMTQAGSTGEVFADCKLSGGRYQNRTECVQDPKGLGVNQRPDLGDHCYEGSGTHLAQAVLSQKNSWVGAGAKNTKSSLAWPASC